MGQACNEACDACSCENPVPEVCDQADNDCDGEIDEEVLVGDECGPRANDGIDNDCDGLVDEPEPCGITGTDGGPAADIGPHLAGAGLGDGCACEVGSRSSGPAWWMLLLVPIPLLRRRRQ